MVFEMIEAKALLAQSMVLEPEIALTPLQVNEVLLVFGLHPPLSEQKNLFDHFVIVSLA
jgi:hypothetical protein